jgi:hypothetical protein
MNDRTIPLDAIRALADYLEHDERKHFELAQEHGEDTSNHIYNHVKAEEPRQAGVQDEIEITAEMIAAGVDLAVDLGVENVSLDTLAEEMYRRMALASRGQHHRSFEPARPFLPPETSA